VRTAALVVTAVSAVLPTFMAVPEELPSTAMGSELLLYLERVLAVFAALLLFVVFLYRSLVHGELPYVISGRGVEWSQIAENATSATVRLQAQIDGLRRELRTLRTSRGRSRGNRD
jgi:hypothetical protein